MFRFVPDRGGPESFLNRSVGLRVETARAKPFRPLCRLLEALNCGPSAARILEYPDIVDGTLIRIEVGIGPNAAEAVMPGASGLAGVSVDTGFARAAGDVEDGLVKESLED